jgi:deoxyribodipyrimidine photo-lyase
MFGLPNRAYDLSPELEFVGLKGVWVRNPLMEVVWFKRDLRTFDHAPLTNAAAAGEVLALYVVEPDYWLLPDTSARQWLFIKDCLNSLRSELEALGLSLTIRVGDMVAVLEALHNERGICQLHSHQETGNMWTFKRDTAVKQWCVDRGIRWREERQNGVIRGLKSRDDWSKRWDEFMSRPKIVPPKMILPADAMPSDRIPDPEELCTNSLACNEIQPGGRPAGFKLLESFLIGRGASYQKGMSSPNTAFSSCSRLSTHLSYGTLSIREVFQASMGRVKKLKESGAVRQGEWLKSLGAFQSRLHWHCHFIQKLESAPQFEVENAHPSYIGIRSESAPKKDHIEAWINGRTGFPFIDACARALRSTGWINFRARAMLQSFASYHLWIHWRFSGVLLAQLFTDYEPGIHWNQVQMQSGTTGVNLARIYNPVKQSRDQDPEGEFIKRWIPELKRLPNELIHEPWLMTAMEQKLHGCVIGKNYPAPIVDHIKAAQEARAKIYQVRKTRGWIESRDAILEKHGSRKGKS